MPTQDELVESIINAMDLLELGNPALNKLASYLYKTDVKLSEYLDDLKIFTQLKKPTLQETQEAGKLLEQIVLLVFKGLKGVQSIKSFQSAGPQYDLLVTGDDIFWQNVCKTLYLEWNQRDIVIEAKATKASVPDKQFARLCSIMDLNLKSAGLGIFITLNGATGFPKKGDPRTRKVSDCRLRQILFHAKTNKMIVVLDKDDIYELTKNGTLIQMLSRKIRDLFELSGLPTSPAEQFQEIDLPPHLKMLYYSAS
ncbi:MULTISPECIES: hypothetical protein [unclassified Nostoc]|uniref:hypothetical protein n=1 Tax=unclassified Nostoc TaxID=2593658 RepID=UPI002AD434CD|nr:MULTISPECIES: hypothetical protein [unclassified Nostoc]MDZ8035000.1 hypothetical protein [Nostoc sp. DedSLP04]MDZ8130336.1 hypothetical protein [Nostoc sp. DedQUE07]